MPTINQGYITLSLIGDVNPFEHGGAFVQVHPDQGFLLTVWEPTSQNLYRVTLEEHTYTNQILSDNRFQAGTEQGMVWYHNYIREIAETHGLTAREMISHIISHSPTRRAQALIMVASYFGWEEFDQYPLHPETSQDLRNLKTTFERWKKQASNLGR